jgi:glycosyltransferase involved in cell wall biosynthesis
MKVSSEEISPKLPDPKTAVTSYPQVTACVPAWNAAEFIEETLESLANQDYPNLVILISVDLCTDNTLNVCKAYAEKNDKFSVIAQTERQGWIGNMNALLQQVQSKYCFFAFHDDLLEPSYVSALITQLEKNLEAVLAFSDMDTTFVDGRVQHGSYTQLEGINDPAKRARLMFYPSNHWWATVHGVFRTGVVQEIGGLKEHALGDFSADWVWLFKLTLYGSFVRVPQLLCHKVYKTQSVSRKWDWSKKRLYKRSARIECLRQLLRSQVSLLIKLSFLEKILRRNIPLWTRDTSLWFTTKASRLFRKIQGLVANL